MEVSTKSACRQKLSAQILPYRTLMKPGKRLGGLQQHPLSFPTFPTEFLTGLRSTGYRADSGLWKRVLCLHSDLRTLEERDLNQEGHNTRTASFHQLTSSRRSSSIAPCISITVGNSRSLHFVHISRQIQTTKLFS